MHNIPRVPVPIFRQACSNVCSCTEAAVGIGRGVRVDPVRPYAAGTRLRGAAYRGAMAAAAGAMAVLGALLAAAGVNAQVPLPNARQLDFMELELTQFM